MSLDDSEDCGCTGDPERAVDDPQYRRALWIVIILNVGFGMIELAAGFLAASQALKADALDFLGDGSITSTSDFIKVARLGERVVQLITTTTPPGEKDSNASLCTLYIFLIFIYSLQHRFAFIIIMFS